MNLVTSLGDVVGWANHNQGVTTLVFSAVVAGATVWYARLTGRLVDETVKLRQAETEPDLAVYLDLNRRDHYELDLVVRNIGRGPAYGVHLHVSDPTFGGRSFAKSGLQAGDAIRYLPPAEEVRYMLASTMRFFRETQIEPVTVRVSYSNKSGGQLAGTYLLDGEHLRGVSGGQATEVLIAESLMRLTQAASLVTNSGGVGGKLRVEVSRPWRPSRWARFRSLLQRWV